MKKRISLVLVLSLMLAFSACVSGKDTNQPTDTLNNEISTDPEETALFPASATVSLEDLPEYISILINNYNLISKSTKKFGVDIPIIHLIADYETTIDTRSYRFRDDDSYISLTISSSLDESIKRQKELKDEYLLFTIFLTQYDDTKNYIAWQSIIGGKSYTQDGIILQYIKGDDSDFLVMLIPKSNIYALGENTSIITTEKSTVSSAQNDTITIGMRNALKKAFDYLDFTAFSRSGLIEQLKYEGYSEEEAIYAVDNCNADWKEQAAKKAQEYLDYSAFSRSGLIDQLLYEGFTQEEAEYGVSAVGY